MNDSDMAGLRGGGPSSAISLATRDFKPSAPLSRLGWRLSTSKSFVEDVNSVELVTECGE
jgi:hypothetical protein